jgi:hypothetical protein
MKKHKIKIKSLLIPLIYSKVEKEKKKVMHNIWLIYVKRIPKASPSKN